jgi:inosine-uridine nucleoside N-ribohydrolase
LDNGVDTIVRFAHATHEAPTWLLATGPLTNLALATDVDPGIGGKIDRVVVMGGAFGSPGGNVTPWAEFNFHADPAAAAQVMASGLPIELVPLDVTHRVILTKADADALRSGDAARTLAACLVRSSVDLYHRATGRAATPMHDPLAAALLVQPALTRKTPRRVDVITEGDRTGHSSSLASANPAVDVSVDVDTGAARSLILALLAGDVPSDLLFYP